MLLPPQGRNYYTAYKAQGAAFGYMVVGPSDRHCTGVYSLIDCYEENDCISVFLPLKGKLHEKTRQKLVGEK